MKNEIDDIQARDSHFEEDEDSRFFDETECHICCSPLNNYGQCPVYKCWR